MKLLLVRHGESTWNAEGRYQGRLDAPLSTRGRAQAQSLAALLRDEQLRTQPAPLWVIFSSPLARAYETAQACALALDVPVQVDGRLTEISHGEWEGKLREDIAARWPELFDAWRTRPHDVRFPDGETLAEVHARFQSFLADLPAGAQSALIITHDVIVRLGVLAARAKPLSAFNEIRIDNAGLTELALDNANLAVVRINDTSHLGSLRSDTLTQAL